MGRGIARGMRLESGPESRPASRADSRRNWGPGGSPARRPRAYRRARWDGARGAPARRPGARSSGWRRRGARTARYPLRASDAAHYQLWWPRCRPLGLVGRRLAGLDATPSAYKTTSSAKKFRKEHCHARPWTGLFAWGELGQNGTPRRAWGTVGAAPRDGAPTCRRGLRNTIPWVPRRAASGLKPAQGDSATESAHG